MAVETCRAQETCSDKELLTMGYSLLQFRVYMLGNQTFYISLGINTMVVSVVSSLRVDIADAYSRNE